MSEYDDDTDYNFHSDSSSDDEDDGSSPLITLCRQKDPSLTEVTKILKAKSTNVNKSD